MLWFAKINNMLTVIIRVILIFFILLVVIRMMGKRQIGEMMRILKKYPDTFSSFSKVNEVFGNFKRKK